MDGVRLKILVGLGVAAGLGAARANPVEFWMIGGARHRVGGSWSVGADTEHHIPTDGRPVPYQHYDAGISRAVGRRWTFSAQFRYVILDGAGRSQREYRPHLNATVNFTTGRLRWVHRNRLEYRFLEDADDTMRYRPRLQAGFPWVHGSWTIEPFIADELFADIERRHLDQNRIMAGVGVGRAGVFRADLFGGVRSLNGQQGWSELTLLGVNVSVAF